MQSPRTQQGRAIPTTQRHPRHDELVSELELWYTRSAPEMGFYVQERRFGFYQRQEDTGRVRVTVSHLPAEDVPTFLEDVREYFGAKEITFYVDDRELDGCIVRPTFTVPWASPTMSTGELNTGTSQTRLGADQDINPMTPAYRKVGKRW